MAEIKRFGFIHHLLATAANCDCEIETRTMVEAELDDGIETDRLEFGYGRRVEMGAAAQTLNLCVA